MEWDRGLSKLFKRKFYEDPIDCKERGRDFKEFERLQWDFLAAFLKEFFENFQGLSPYGSEIRKKSRDCLLFI